MKPLSSSDNVVNLSKLTTKQARMIDDISADIYVRYNRIVDDIIDDFDLKGTKLLLTVSCRNTFTNLLFNPVSKLLLLEKLTQQDKNIKLAKIDNKQQKILESLNAIFKINVDIVNNRSGNAIVFFDILLNIAKSAYIALNDWFWYRLFRLKKIPKDPIVYLDTFLY